MSLNLCVLAAVLFVTAGGAHAQSGSNCEEADPNDNEPDDAALQACLNRGGTIALRPGAPGYILERGLILTQSGTVLTSMSPPSRVTVLAHPDLFAAMLGVSDSVSRYEISHIFFDGNVTRRRRRGECAGYRGFGTNLQPRGSNFIIRDISSVRAMCGSAMEVLGRDYEIANNLIANNGLESGAPEPWADGITLLNCTGGYVHDNTIKESTDVGLVVGGGRGCRIENNIISQSAAYAFAGFHVYNFNVGTGGQGNHAGSVYKGNRITSSLNKMGFGLGVGSHPWDKGHTVSDAGVITANTISGAVVNLAVDGVDNGRITGNALSGARGSRTVAVNCRSSANYTAGHFGKTVLQPGWIGVTFHDGGCQATGEGLPSVAACDAVTQPAPHWGMKIGLCLKSCGALGGTRSFDDGCEHHGMSLAGAAYDVKFCCKPSRIRTALP